MLKTWAQDSSLPLNQENKTKIKTSRRPNPNLNILPTSSSSKQTWSTLSSRKPATHTRLSIHYWSSIFENCKNYEHNSSFKQTCLSSENSESYTQSMHNQKILHFQLWKNLAKRSWTWIKQCTIPNNHHLCKHVFEALEQELHTWFLQFELWKQRWFWCNFKKLGSFPLLESSSIQQHFFNLQWTWG